MSGVHVPLVFNASDSRLPIESLRGIRSNEQRHPAGLIDNRWN